jgi:hypothetical protein
VKIYKATSFILMLLFAITGMLFLGIPDRVLVFFNNLSTSLGMMQAPVIDWNFYLILAVGYMYLVTLLAFLMFRRPENHYFPLLLIHAKTVSSLLSLAFFLLQEHYLIYLANFIIDGLIGIVVATLYLKMRRKEWAFS